MARSLKTFQSRSVNRQTPKAVSLGVAFVVNETNSAADCELLAERIASIIQEKLPAGSEVYAEWKVQAVSSMTVQPSNELIPRTVWMTGSEAEAMSAMPENPRTAAVNLTEEGAY